MMLPLLLQEHAVCRLGASSTLHQLLTPFAPPSRRGGAMPGTCRTTFLPLSHKTQAHCLGTPGTMSWRLYDEPPKTWCLYDAGDV